MALASQIDWFKVTDDLERLGVSLRSQALTAEVSLGSVYYWRTGGEPKYRNGQLLLSLYMNRVGEEPPTRSTLPST